MPCLKASAEGAAPEQRRRPPAGSPVTTHCPASLVRCGCPRLPLASPWIMAVNGNGTSLGSAGSGGSGGSSQCVAAMHSFYAAINSGDSEALCALLAPNVEWDCFELPTSAQKVPPAVPCRRLPPVADRGSMQRVAAFVADVSWRLLQPLWLQ